MGLVQERSKESPRVFQHTFTPQGKGFIYAEMIVKELLFASVECQWGNWRGSTSPGYFSAPMEGMFRGLANASGRVGAAILTLDANQLFNGPDIVRNMNETKFLIELEDKGGARTPLTIIGRNLLIGRVWGSYPGKAPWLTDVDPGMTMMMFRPW